MGRRTRDEAWADLEVIPIELEVGRPSPCPPGNRFPAGDAFAVLKPPPSAWASGDGVPPAGHDELWPTPDEVAARPWPDCSVRRVLDLPFVVVGGVLDGALRSVATTGRMTVRGCTRSCPDERRVLAGLRVQTCSVPVSVEVVAAPWSRTRTEVRLELRGRRRLRLPRRYFDVADEVAERLRLAILGVAREEVLVAGRSRAVVS